MRQPAVTPLAARGSRPRTGVVPPGATGAPDSPSAVSTSPFRAGGSDADQAILRTTLARLLDYCHRHDWAGHDPYDALNSEWLARLPFLDFKFARLVLIQSLKRCPFNLRTLLRVPPVRNPKGLALFLSSLVKLSRIGWNVPPGAIRELIDGIVRLRSPDERFWSWGYSFPWQTRTIIVPRGAPNLVCTTFVASALLDAYENGDGPECLSIAQSAADYILEELYWSEGDDMASFSYPLPSVRVPVHNANFLAAALLCRVSRVTGDTKYQRPALRVARYSAGRQRSDGSWAYGEGPKQQWIDNFHTGFNLCALQEIGRDAATSEFGDHLRRGFSFYRDHFIAEDGAARYFHDRTYPVDAHSVAQTILTFATVGTPRVEYLPFADKAFRWARKHLWDERGFFYYQKRRFVTVRIPYMRWTQAWMLLALATLLGAEAPGARDSASPAKALPV